jgi:hypothetical protein
MFSIGAFFGLYPANTNFSPFILLGGAANPQLGGLEEVRWN